MSAILLGTEAGGNPVAIRFFRPERATRMAVIGDPALPRLLAIRALTAGAKVQVVTSQPEEWLKLPGSTRPQAGRIAVVPVGTPPPSDAAQVAPLMVIHDTSAEPPPLAGPCQSVVSVLGDEAVAADALRGLDAVFLYRSIPAWRAAVIAAMNLSMPAVRSLHGIPRDVVAVAWAGAVTLVQLTPDASVRALVQQPVHAQLLRPVSVGRLSARQDSEPLLWIWQSDKNGAGTQEEVA
jgi:hypothetical protein